MNDWQQGNQIHGTDLRITGSILDLGMLRANCEFIRSERLINATTLVGDIPLKWQCLCDIYTMIND